MIQARRRVIGHFGAKSTFPVRPHAPFVAPPSMKIGFSGLVCGDGSVCDTSNAGWRLLGGRETLCGLRSRR